MTRAHTPSILVIGYGNTLRRDDALGPTAAEAIQRWGLPGVNTIVQTQLTPELAADLAAADLALFVDARAGSATREIAVERLEPLTACPSPALAHASSPQILLGLCQALYGRAPAAELISIPAPDLGLGEGLSALAARGLQAALDLIWWRIHAALATEPITPQPCPGQDALNRSAVPASPGANP